MFSITGEVVSCYTIPPSDKYPQTSHKLQLMGDQSTKDGQIRKEMVTMTIPEKLYRDLTEKVGQVISLPVGLFVSSNRLNIYYPANT